MILDPQRMGLAEQMRRDWVANVEVGTSVEDVMDPAFWSHKAAELNKFDRIEVREETGKWIAELICIEAGRNWASMHFVAKHDLQPNDVPVHSAKHEVVWRSLHHKWCVKRLADNEILQTGMENKQQAVAWLANYEQVVAKT